MAPADPPHAQALAGLLVLDLTRILAGPTATQLLADLGAEVIKIETPGGEQLRRRHGDGGATLPFAMLNSGKNCVELDLKAEEDRAALLRMAAGADVLVENYRPGVMDRLGLGWDAM